MNNFLAGFTDELLKVGGDPAAYQQELRQRQQTVRTQSLRDDLVGRRAAVRAPVKTPAARSFTPTPRPAKPLALPSGFGRVGR